MNNLQKYSHHLSRANFWKIFIIITIILGIYLRFANLERKVYSADEVRSIMRLSGYKSQDVIQGVFTGKIVSVNELQKYQKPNSERSLNDALKAFTANPEHPPFYPLLTRFWLQLMPIANSARVFSILLNILALPCLYWLCVELFNSVLTGWVAMAFFAVSPFQILVAQNTTQYSLWTIAILVSSAMLLRALRENKGQNWLGYSISLALGFYTHLFFAMVAISQGVYVFFIERFRLTKTLIMYCLAGLGSLLLFSPWLMVILNNLDTIEVNTRYYRQFKTNAIEIIKTFSRHLGHLFVDFFHRKGRLESFLHLLIFLLVIYALYYLIRSTEPKIWLFVFSLIFIPLLLQIVPDLISSSVRSLQARYYLPCFLGIQLCLSYFMASHINSTSSRNLQKYFWQQVFLLLLLFGIVSGVCLAWTDDAGLDDQRGTASSTNLPIAAAISQMQKPLVISEATYSFILALSHLVNDPVKFQLFHDVQQWKTKLNLTQATDRFSNVVVLYPDSALQAFLNSQKSFEQKKVVDGLVEIKKK